MPKPWCRHSYLAKATVLLFVAAQTACLVMLVQAAGLWSQHPSGKQSSRRSETPHSHSLVTKKEAPDQTTMETIIGRFRNAQLARIFLTNDGPLDRPFRQQLAETGVLHHLAISAGQLAPVLFVIDGFLRHLPLGLKPGPRQRRLHVRLCAAAAITVGLCAMYGMTGSLVRLIMVSCARQALVIALLLATMRFQKLSATWVAPLVQMVCGSSGPTVVVALIICALSGLHLMADWSFLFSAVGALSCTTGLFVCGLLRHSVLFRWPWLRLVVTFVVIQMCAALAMAPLVSTGIGASVVTNLVVSPIVGFVIVPATVFLALLTRSGALPGGPLDALFTGPIAVADWGLGAFRAVVETVAHWSADPGPPWFATFSEASYRYVVILVIGSLLVPQLAHALIRKAKA